MSPRHGRALILMAVTVAVAPDVGAWLIAVMLVVWVIAEAVTAWFRWLDDQRPR